MNNNAKDEQISIAELKKTVSTRIETELAKPENIARVTAFLMQSSSDEKSTAEINDYIGRFVTHLINDEGVKQKDGTKRYLVECTIGSLMRAFFEAMQVRLPIDRRGLVYLTIQPGNRAELEIGYKGFIHRINELYSNPDWKIELVFAGDEFYHWSENGNDSYRYMPDPKRTTKDYSKVIWAFAYFSYTVNGKDRSKIEIMDIRELKQVRSKAKTKYVWDEWEGEMYKKAIIRRACKLPFISADDEGEIEELDNKSYDLEKPPQTRAGLLEAHLLAENDRRKEKAKPELTHDDTKTALNNITKNDVTKKSEDLAVIDHTLENSEKTKEIITGSDQIELIMHNNVKINVPATDMGIEKGLTLLLKHILEITDIDDRIAIFNANGTLFTSCRTPKCIELSDEVERAVTFEPTNKGETNAN